MFVLDLYVWPDSEFLQLCSEVLVASNISDA